MIRVEGLEKSYGRHRALCGVSFEIEAGEVVGFLGPNGAGKSTTMRILCGVLERDAGKVSIDGCDPRTRPLAARAAIGYLPEQTPLYRRMRVLDYLDFVGRVRGLARAERRSALERVRQDCGLEGYERRRIEELSKGYRQRVGLAQALIGDPPVLILDEPTSGLDPNEVARLRELVARLGERKTVLLSTHVLGEVEEVCARVLILSGGRLVADGALATIGAAQVSTLRVCVDAGAEQLRGLARELELEVLALSPGEGRVTAELECDEADRFAAAAHARGWRLFELTHERATLEQVFRRVTTASRSAGVDGGRE
jgi:ABC-2 type transport system ATP-binding protein